MRICTIIARNYLAQARVLALSYAEHNRGAPCSVLLIDDPERTVGDEGEPFEILRPDELDIERFEGLAAMYDITELATAVKPWLLRHLLERDGEPISYFDPDIRFFADIDEIARLAREEQLVLIPHVAHSPVPVDGWQPSELDLLASGTYNLGFIALAPGATAGRVIAWWSERLRFDCVIDHGLGMFVDQRWFDLVASVAPHFHILRDPGANVAYWNLHEREVARDGDRYTVNGEPLRFFHFSGFDPSKPYLLSKHQSRVRLTDEPIIGELCATYAELVRDHGFERTSRARSPYERLPDGTVMTSFLRRMYRDGERVGAFRYSPFTDDGAAEFFNWLQEPAELGAAHGVTRLCWAIYRARPDVSVAFPDIDGADGPGFMNWVHAYGIEDLGLRPELFPTVAAYPTGALADLEDDDGEPWGVNVAGYLRSELGVGEAARGVIAALDARGVPVMPIHGKDVPTNRQGHAFAFLNADAAPFPINLICVNADRLPRFMKDAGPAFSNGRYAIGFWWWEVSTFPEDWTGAFKLLDELWVGSEHVADAVRPIADIPVVTVRIPVALPPIVPYSRAELGLPDGFVFLFMFDFFSVFARKNPIAVVEAFRRSFEPGDGASLVLKCINHGSDPDNYDRLRAAAAGHEDIHIVDRYVSPDEKNAMIASCDCYVSLHRSEGFGLSPAEAMYLGKPVIATRYSGNLDFMTDANSYLVDYTLRPVGEGNLPYPAHGTWAEPDVGHAALLMRQVFDDPQAARERGRVAAADLRRTYSLEAAGQTMEARLARVRARLAVARRAADDRGSSDALARAQMLLARGPVAGPGRGPGRALAQRLARRLMRAATAHEHQVDEAIVAALAEAREDRAGLGSAAPRGHGLQAATTVAALLAELRRQDVGERALRAELKALKTELAHRYPADAPTDADDSPPSR